MNKLFFAIVFFTIGLNAQSKLFPNVEGSSKMEQTLAGNTLSLIDPDFIIYKVILYNKETLEPKEYENHSKSIDIDLNNFQSGLYTGMIYVNGNIVVFNVEVEPLDLNGIVEVAEVIDEVKPTLNIEEKTIRHYRVISTIYSRYNLSQFNVFSEARKNDLIRKNALDLKTATGYKNTTIIYAVYTDNTEQLIYETEVPKDFKLFEKGKDFAKTN